MAAISKKCGHKKLNANLERVKIYIVNKISILVDRIYIIVSNIFCKFIFKPEILENNLKFIFFYPFIIFDFIFQSICN